MARVLSRRGRPGSSLKRSLWRMWYEYLARRYPASDWAFMNYGFAELDPRTAPPLLHPADEADRLSIQLYHHLAAAVDLRGGEVLEVGCGRGGGCSYLRRYSGARAVIGVDLAEAGVRLCRRDHGAAGLAFVLADAESLPFADGCFDAVVNVESSFYYPSLERFLAEARRVLRPGGHLLLADWRYSYRLAGLRAQLAGCGLEVVGENRITPNVLAALKLDHGRKLALIREHVPWLLQRPFQRFAGLEGTMLYRAFGTGRAEYLSYIMRKAAGRLSA